MVPRVKGHFRGFYDLLYFAGGKSDNFWRYISCHISSTSIVKLGLALKTYEHMDSA